MARWQHPQQISTHRYRCGYCGLSVASDRGLSSDDPHRRIYICPHCEKSTYFEMNLQVPGVVPGVDVAHLPPDLNSLYREARNCCGVGAYTASVLASRKMLMNIAVEQGASQGAKFIEYVDFLAANGYIPPNGKHWVDHIRRKGNEATHEIALMNGTDAEELLAFLEMLLKFVYEFPARVPRTP